VNESEEMIPTLLDGEEGANGHVLTRREGRVWVDLVVEIALRSERARRNLYRDHAFRLDGVATTTGAVPQPT
jgi:hypothetical protein